MDLSPVPTEEEESERDCRLLVFNEQEIAAGYNPALQDVAIKLEDTVLSIAITETAEWLKGGGSSKIEAFLFMNKQKGKKTSFQEDLTAKTCSDLLQEITEGLVRRIHGNTVCDLESRWINCGKVPLLRKGNTLQDMLLEGQSHEPDTSIKRSSDLVTPDHTEINDGGKPDTMSHSKKRKCKPI